MIARKELESAGRSLAFNAYQAEKDYLQHAFLAALYAVSANEFVFKGGTALQKAFGLDRFSEDIDFTFAGEAGTAMAFMEKAAGEFGRLTEASISKKKEWAGSLSATLKAEGSLYDGTERSVQTIIVDISMRERVIIMPSPKRIVPLYADLRPYVALCMGMDELFAEKIRAIMTRERPRDVYDAWFLLRKNAVFSKEKTDAKLAYYGKKFEFADFERAVLTKQKLWDNELKALLKNVPPFKETSEELLNGLKEHSL